MNSYEPSELDDQCHELVQRLSNDDLFAADEKKRGVRCRVHPTDVVRVDHNHFIIEARQLDHEFSFGSALTFRIESSKRLVDPIQSNGHANSIVRWHES